jgi:hypothetical protein
MSAMDGFDHRTLQRMMYLFLALEDGWQIRKLAQLENGERQYEFISDLPTETEQLRDRALGAPLTQPSPTQTTMRLPTQ